MLALTSACSGTCATRQQAPGHSALHKQAGWQACTTCSNQLVHQQGPLANVHSRGLIPRRRSEGRQKCLAAETGYWSCITAARRVAEVRIAAHLLAIDGSVAQALKGRQHQLPAHLGCWTLSGAGTRTQPLRTASCRLPQSLNPCGASDWCPFWTCSCLEAGRELLCLLLLSCPLHHSRTTDSRAGSTRHGPGSLRPGRPGGAWRQPQALCRLGQASPARGQLPPHSASLQALGCWRCPAASKESDRGCGVSDQQASLCRTPQGSSPGAGHTAGEPVWQPVAGGSCVAPHCRRRTTCAAAAPCVLSRHESRHMCVPHLRSFAGGRGSPAGRHSLPALPTCCAFRVFGARRGQPRRSGRLGGAAGAGCASCCSAL